MPLGRQSVDFKDRIPVDGHILLVAEVVCLDLVQQLLVQSMMQCIRLAALTSAALSFGGEITFFSG